MPPVSSRMMLKLTPAQTDSFRGEAETREGAAKKQGRRLPKVWSVLRSLRRPCSGRTLPVPHFWRGRGGISLGEGGRCRWRVGLDVLGHRLRRGRWRLRFWLFRRLSRSMARRSHQWQPRDGQIVLGVSILTIVIPLLAIGGRS